MIVIRYYYPKWRLSLPLKLVKVSNCTKLWINVKCVGAIILTGSDTIAWKDFSAGYCDTVVPFREKVFVYSVVAREPKSVAFSERFNEFRNFITFNFQMIPFSDSGDDYIYSCYFSIFNINILGLRFFVTILTWLLVEIARLWVLFLSDQ